MDTLPIKHGQITAPPSPLTERECPSGPYEPNSWNISSGEEYTLGLLAFQLNKDTSFL
jgi:hypothetical protein